VEYIAALSGILLAVIHAIALFEVMWINLGGKKKYY
jgi:hypothetical protein